MSTLSIAIDRAASSLDAVRGFACSTLTTLTDAELMAGFHDAAELRKAVDGILLEFSAVIATRSPAGPGVESLAKKAGFASPTALIADTAGINPAEAAKVVRVADATTPKRGLDGQLRSRYEHAAEALGAGMVTTEHVDLIARTLDSVRENAHPVELVRVEQALVELAPTMRAGELKQACERAKRELDPGSLEPNETAQREARALTFSTRNGMTVLTWLMAADQAALVRSGIDAGARSLGRGSDTQPEVRPDPRELARFDLNGMPLNGPAKWHAQLRADAAFAIFDHGATCSSRDAKMPSYTAVVRMDLDVLRNQLAEAFDSSVHATERTETASVFDGMDQPISASLARRMAAKAGIVPAVMGCTSSIPLDLGTRARLFTPGQRLALAERDGGCAWPGCGQTLAWSDAHHLDWWSRGGKTDISNGLMLCPSHHHRIHDNGWTIEFRPPPGAPDGAHIPWFIPPPEWVAVDPAHRTALPGGNPAKRLHAALATAA